MVKKILHSFFTQTAITPAKNIASAILTVTAACCLVVNIITLAPLYADTHIRADTDLQSGWAHISGADIWYSSAGAAVKFDSANSKTVKACIECSTDIFSVPETDITNAGFVGMITIDKAYVKLRFPWLSDSSVRLSAGKMPVSWGYGLYYNAGDIIFGAEPSASAERRDTQFTFTSASLKPEAAAALNKESGATEDIAQLITSNSSQFSDSALSSSGLSDLRINSDWCASFTVPCSSAATVEIIGLPPIDTKLNSAYGRFGGRALFQPSAIILENCEAGYIASGDLSRQTLYAAADGTLWFDYNICASASFTDRTFDKDSTALSAAIIRAFTIRTDSADHSLQLRTEGLIYPSQKKASAFCFASYDISEKTNCALSYILNYTDTATIHYCGCSFVWTPVQSLELSLQSIIRCDDPSEAAAVLASLSYSY